MAYNSKYTGQEVEELLSKTTELNVSAVDLGESVEDVELPYITQLELDTAIANAIILTINASY